MTSDRTPSGDTGRSAEPADELATMLEAIRADLSDGAVYPRRVMERHAPRLLAAVEAILKRHVPAVIIGNGLEDGAFRYCSACSGHPKWPCPEVAEIASALTGKTPRA